VLHFRESLSSQIHGNVQQGRNFDYPTAYTGTSYISVGSDKRQSSDKSHTDLGFLSHFEQKKGFKTSNFGRSFPTPKINDLTTKNGEKSASAAQNCMRRNKISATANDVPLRTLDYANNWTDS
jgi:hypothetical protein